MIGRKALVAPLAALVLGSGAGVAVSPIAARVLGSGAGSPPAANAPRSGAVAGVTEREEEQGLRPTFRGRSRR